VVDVSVPLPSAPAVPTSLSGRTCPSCNAPLLPDDVFCRKCGTRLVPSSCVSCGAKLLADDAFCRKCGAPVAR
jgi:ribosomal protein L40E